MFAAIKKSSASEKKRKNYLAALIAASMLHIPQVHAQSNLLESVKRNPQEAKSLCNNFRRLNSSGISATSQQALEKTSRQKNLNMVDAEILSIYVIGLHCPDVR